jgi:hypothetical protein
VGTLDRCEDCHEPSATLGGGVYILPDMVCVVTYSVVTASSDSRIAWPPLTVSCKTRIEAIKG